VTTRTDEASTVRSSDLASATWRKGSRINDGGECVEVAQLPGRVAIRDSKDPAGPVLAFTPTEWRAFLGSVGASSFDWP
jgi:hypothetical protein